MFLIKHKSGKPNKLDFANMAKKGTIADWKTNNSGGRFVACRKDVDEMV